MKKLLLALTLLSPLTLFAPIMDPITVTAAMENGRKVLRWTGQRPPYKIQRKTPTSWVDISSHIFANEFVLPLTESSTAFYRVRTIDKPKSVTLEWDRNPEPDVIGYLLYYGFASGDYQEPWFLGNVTKTTIVGLAPGTTYYFAVVAQNAAGLNSEFSNEVVYEVEAP